MSANKQLTMLFLACFLCVNSFAAFQRLSIIPQNITIQPKEHENFTTLSTRCIDYYRFIPTPNGLKKAPPYNQVYSSSSPEIKINGTVYKGGFKLLLEGRIPLLILSPQSASETIIRINATHPDSKSIESLEINFNSNIQFGNIPMDRDVHQAEYIFNTWGGAIRQQDFWKKAQILDLLEQSGRIQHQDYTSVSKELVNELVANFNSNAFSPKVFKYLVENDAITLNSNNEIEITNHNLLNYANAINTKDASKELVLVYCSDNHIENSPTLQRAFDNLYPNNFSTRQREERARAETQKKFNESQSQLTRIDASNKNIEDTLINGQRFVLMVAWKSKSFSKQWIENEQYTSYHQFFENPLFLTTPHDIDHWKKQGEFEGLSREQCSQRMCEILGLPPNSTNEEFLEFWVDENDLFRPALDSSKSLSYLSWRLGDGYLNQLAKFTAESYSDEALLKKYPFTGMGYTYDWNPANASHFGVTEFVLREGKTIYRRRTVPTKDYLTE